MQNCPSTANTCPSRRIQQNSQFREALSTQTYRDMDGLPIDVAVYREALEALRAVLLDGCSQCVRNAVIWLANDMKWPPNRSLQVLLVENLLARIAPTVH